MIVVSATVALIVLLWLFFERTLNGKALRATAVNRIGARLMGIRPSAPASSPSTLAALIGALSGVLIGPITTVYYDTGFLIGLKGFVAAIIGGLVSYPLAAVGALAVGLVESFGSFWASAFKEVIVFTLILPVLLLALARRRPRRGRGRGASMTRRCAASHSRAVARRPCCRGRAAGAGVLDHAAQLHRHRRAGRARAGAAHRRRRPHLVRPGRLRRHRRLHHRGG